MSSHDLDEDEYPSVTGLDRSQSIAFWAVVRDEQTPHVAGDLVGVSYRTVYRWQKLDAWQNAETVYQCGVLKEVRRGLMRLGQKAVKALDDVVSNTGARDADRLTASFGILDRVGLSARQTVDITHSGTINADAGPIDLAAIDGSLAALDET